MKIIKESYDGSHTLVVKGQGDGFKNFLEVLKYLKYSGNAGHSFAIVADPDAGDEKVESFWDGDGADRIDSITFDNEEIK